MMSFSSNLWLSLSLLIPPVMSLVRSAAHPLIMPGSAAPYLPHIIMQLDSQALVHAPVQVLLALYLIDDFTGFQVTNLLELPEPYGIAFTWGIVLPTVFVFVASITNFIFQDNLILRVRGLWSVASCCKHWGRAAVPCLAGLTCAGPAGPVNWALQLPRAAIFSAAMSGSMLFALRACSWLGSCPCSCLLPTAGTMPELQHSSLDLLWRHSDCQGQSRDQSAGLQQLQGQAGVQRTQTRGAQVALHSGGGKLLEVLNAKASPVREL